VKRERNGGGGGSPYFGGGGRFNFAKCRKNAQVQRETAEMAANNGKRPQRIKRQKTRQTTEMYLISIASNDGNGGKRHKSWQTTEFPDLAFF
jgi:hypothetical protein